MVFATKHASGVLDLSTKGTRLTHHFRYDQSLLLRREGISKSLQRIGCFSGQEVRSPQPKHSSSAWPWDLYARGGSTVTSPGCFSKRSPLTLEFTKCGSWCTYGEESPPSRLFEITCRPHPGPLASSGTSDAFSVMGHPLLSSEPWLPCSRFSLSATSPSP